MNLNLLRGILGISVMVLTFLALQPVLADSTPTLEDFSLSELEHRADDIESELDTLAIMTLRSGVGNLGWESRAHSETDHTEWAEISLPPDRVVDTIILSPILWHDSALGIQADGFPVEFQIIAGSGESDQGTVLAAFDAGDRLLPRIAPVVIPVKPTRASWIQVRATRLSPRAMDGKFLFQLSEIMVFSSGENIAIRRPVKISSMSKRRVFPSTSVDALVDGFTPYLMDSAEGSGSEAFVAFYLSTKPCRLVLDLGRSQPLDEIHLHSADLSENVPQMQHSDYAIPTDMVIEGANKPDFSDAVQLVKYHKRYIYDAGPILMWRFPETNCRYIRLRVGDGYKAPEAEEFHRCVGFAEIQVFANGRNVASGRSVVLRTPIRAYDGEPPAMTDGKNHFGKILPIQNWLQQLSRRHDLETELPRVRSELSVRYAQQKNYRTAARWLGVLTVVGIAITIMIERMIHMREMAKLKERLAADLHDELGADLHTIGLLSDLAANAKDRPEKLSSLLSDIRTTTEETGLAVRHITDLQSHLPYSGLASLMQQSAVRILINLTHDFTAEEKMKDQGIIRIMLVEDHPKYRRVIEMALAEEPEMNLVSTFGTAEKALCEVPSLQPDIILLDLNLPGMSGLETIPLLDECVPDSKIIVLSQSDAKADVISAIRLGASGYLLKSSTVSQISDGIRAVMLGGSPLDPNVTQYLFQGLQNKPGEAEPEKPLSEREMEILKLLAKGLLKKQIGDHLGIRYSSVATYIRRLYEKLDVLNAASAIDKAYRTGILERQD
eukprot:g3950.t1